MGADNLGLAAGPRGYAVILAAIGVLRLPLTAFGVAQDDRQKSKCLDAGCAGRIQHRGTALDVPLPILRPCLLRDIQCVSLLTGWSVLDGPVQARRNKIQAGPFQGTQR